MYRELFNSVTGANYMLYNTSRALSEISELLKNAQIECEEMYEQSDKSHISLLEYPAPDKETTVD